MNVQRIKAALTSARTWLLEPVFSWSYDNDRGHVRHGEIPRGALILGVVSAVALVVAFLAGC